MFYDYSEPLTECAHKFTVFFDKREDAEALALVCGCKLTGYRGGTLYGLTPSGTGKLQMIQQLAEKLELSLENVAAFGDDENDIPMLENCGLGVAMANAGEDVKAAADQIALSNDEDGVAWFVEREILC